MQSDSFSNFPYISSIFFRLKCKRALLKMQQLQVLVLCPWVRVRVSCFFLCNINHHYALTQYLRQAGSHWRACPHVWNTGNISLRKSLDIIFCGKWMKCKVKVYSLYDNSQVQDAIILHASKMQRQGLPLVQIQMLTVCSENTASNFIILDGCSLTLLSSRHHVSLFITLSRLPAHLLVPIVYNKPAEFPGDSAASSSEELTHPVPPSLYVPVISSSPVTRVKSSPNSYRLWQFGVFLYFSRF